MVKTIKTSLRSEMLKKKTSLRSEMVKKIKTSLRSEMVKKIKTSLRSEMVKKRNSLRSGKSKTKQNKILCTLVYNIWIKKFTIIYGLRFPHFHSLQYSRLYLSTDHYDIFTQSENLIHSQFQFWCYVKGNNSSLLVYGQREREMFYLTTHSTHFIYGYMASDIWLRTILIVRKETCCRHIGYSYRLTARVLLYAPSHRQDNTYHGLCYTSRGALALYGQNQAVSRRKEMFYLMTHSTVIWKGKEMLYFNDALKTYFIYGYMERKGNALF